MPNAVSNVQTVTTATSVTLSGLTGNNVIMAGIGPPSATTNFSGVSFVVEGTSDGTNFGTIPMVRQDTGEPASGVIFAPDGHPIPLVSRNPGNWSAVRTRIVSIAAGSVMAGVSAQPAVNLPPTVVSPERIDSTGGKFPVEVAAGTTTAAFNVAAGPARLCRVVVQALGTAALTFYDNPSAASGTKLFIIPASAAAGTIYDVQMPALTGITAGKVNNSPDVTVSFTPL
jgi:hypothetical protein